MPVTKPVLACAADISHLPGVVSRLGEFFDLRLVGEVSPASVEDALRGADAYFASLKVRLAGEMIARAERLRVIVTPSTGLDHLDLEAAAARGIPVLGLKDERALLDRVTATAELAWALALSCARRLPEAFDASRAGRWARDELRGRQLSGKTCGIIGCGRLGTMVADYARAFRMTVLGNDLRQVRLEGVEMVPLEELLARSDLVSLHIHLTAENRRFLDRARLRLMKPGSILVNTSRGAIVDEEAVLAGLDEGRPAAYGTDVVEGEWRDDLENHPLVAHARQHGNVVITPHVGGVTFESQAMAYEHAAEMLISFFREADQVPGA